MIRFSIIKSILTSVIIFLLCHNLSAQTSQTDYEEMSYSNFFEQIETEKDSIFERSNIIVRFNSETDSLFKIFLKNDFVSFKSDVTKKIEITKKLVLRNVHFEKIHSLNGIFKGNTVAIDEGVLTNIRFLKKVEIYNTASLGLTNCIFEEGFLLRNTDGCDSKSINHLQNSENSIIIAENVFMGKTDIVVRCSASGPNYQTFVTENYFLLNDGSENGSLLLSLDSLGYGGFFNNSVKGNNDNVLLSFKKVEWPQVSNNVFSNVTPFIIISEIGGLNDLNIEDNIFKDFVRFEIDKILPAYSIDWEQFEGKLISAGAFNQYIYQLLDKGIDTQPMQRDYKKYSDSVILHFPKSYDREMALRGLLYNHYKSSFNRKNANAVYIEMKDMETSRLKIIYAGDKTFNNYFTVKINEFLKYFSDYGTRPSKAIIVSLYIILIFALIYFFFPNSWDESGHRRILNRFNFFSKYFKEESGMHEIYLRDESEKLSTYESFRSEMENSNLEVPKFFISWSKPVYKYAIAGTKLKAYLLSKTDVLNGKWQDIPPKKKRIKNLQIGFFFFVVLMSDILFKALNALMLSINTFTTLGFGEIPIKGIPRYLAIIEGFIGWFMLTIFSVSLISQILN